MQIQFDLNELIELICVTIYWTISFLVSIKNFQVLTVINTWTKGKHCEMEEEEKLSSADGYPYLLWFSSTWIDSRMEFSEVTPVLLEIYHFAPCFSS